MEEGPPPSPCPPSPCRGRRQTAVSCAETTLGVVSVTEKTLIGSGTDREGERKRTTVDVSKACQTTSKPRPRGGCGMSLGWSLLTAQAASGMEVARARSWLSWGTWEPAPGYSGGATRRWPGWEREIPQGWMP